METVSLGSVLKLVGDFGMVGLVIFLWWSDNKRIWAVLAQYKQDMVEQREMYISNVSLCKDFSGIASDLRAIVVLNIQKMTEVADAVNQNQFCPLVRLDQKKFSRLVDQVKKENSQEGNHERRTS
jgi:hypothetical protein